MRGTSAGETILLPTKTVPAAAAEWRPTRPDLDPSKDQGNPEALADCLEANFRQNEFVGFFGYFGGNASQPAQARKDVPVRFIPVNCLG